MEISTRRTFTGYIKLRQRIRHTIATAQGAQRTGQVGGLLARLEATGIGVRRQHRSVLGRGQGHAAADAQGAQPPGQLGGVFSKLEAAGVDHREKTVRL